MDEGVLHLQEQRDQKWWDTRILGRGPARLLLENRSERPLTRDILAPSGLGVGGAVPVTVESGQCLELPLEWRGLEPLQVFEVAWGGLRLSACLSPEPEVVVEWGALWARPQQEAIWIEGELVVRAGAIWIDGLPEGVTAQLPDHGLLLETGPDRLPFRLLWQGRPLLWELASGQSLQLSPKVVVAGQVRIPSRCLWPWRYRQLLSIPVQALDGAVEVVSVEGLPPGYLYSLPEVVAAESEADVQLSFHSETTPSGVDALEVRLVLADGRRFPLEIELDGSDPPEFLGWLLLDYGASSSAAALLHPQGSLEVLSLGEAEDWFPSALVYDPTGKARASDTADALTVSSAKRYLGLETFPPESEGRTAQSLVRDGLNLLLERVQQRSGRHYPRVVLSYPAGFSPRQLSLLEVAFREACPWSLERLLTLPEPLAVALETFRQQSDLLDSPSGKLLTVDVGAATTDSALMELDRSLPDHLYFQVVGVGGNNWFGGGDLSQWLASELNLPWRAAESVKCHGEISLSVRQALLPRLQESLLRALPYNLEQDPDVLLLSGRGSLYPDIGRVLQERFPRARLLQSPHPKGAVVMGCASHPDVLASLGPRRPEPGRPLLELRGQLQQDRVLLRLGCKVLGAGKAEFIAWLQPGIAWPEAGVLRGEIQGLAFVAGENTLEVYENLGLDEAFVTDQGGFNPQLVPLQKFVFQLQSQPDFHQTRLVWSLTRQYRLQWELWEAGARLVQQGPVPLW